MKKKDAKRPRSLLMFMKKRYKASKKSTDVYKKNRCKASMKKSTDVYEREVRSVEEDYCSVEERDGTPQIILFQ